MGEADVYEEVRHDLMRYATALVGPTDAEDVVSSVVTRVLGRPGGLGGLREPRPYLMRSVLNEVRARHRASRRAVPILGVGGDEEAVFTRRVEATDGHDADVVVAVIAALPPRQRAAAFLVFFEEHTPTEAADLMGCRPGTVRRYIHLARRALEEALHG